jgi:hypothetical protein
MIFCFSEKEGRKLTERGEKENSGRSRQSCFERMSGDNIPKAKRRVPNAKDGLVFIDFLFMLCGNLGAGKD